MDDPAVLVLLLKQRDRSLEDHTEDFVFLANYTSYPDSCLCSFYQTGLNTSTRAQLSGDGPRESLAAFIEWVLVSCNSQLTVDIVDDDTSPTRDPEPSQLPPRSAALPEPTTDREPEPAAVVEPSPSGATELPIVPEPQVSDQVREPTVQAAVDAAVEIAGAMECPAHGATAEGEHKLDLGDLIDFHSDTLILQPSPELNAWEYIPPNLPLPPPLIDLVPVSTPSSLDSVSLSARPQLTICGVGSPLVCRSPAPLALSLEDPSTPPSASETQTPPRSCDPAAPPWLPAPSSPPEPSVHQLHRAPSSLRLRLGQSSPYLHLGTTVLWLHHVPSSLWLRGLLLPSSSTSVLCRSGSTFTSVAEASGSTLALRILGFTPALQLSVTASGSTTTCSAAVGRPHGVGGHSSIMAPPSVGSSMGHHRDCGLGLHLAPPAPGFPLAPPTLHSPMDFYVVLCVASPFSCSTPSSRAPTLPPQLDCYGARTRLSGRGRTVTCLFSLVT